jgi:hypothetical protein
MTPLHPTQENVSWFAGGGIESTAQVQNRSWYDQSVSSGDGHKPDQAAKQLAFVQLTKTRDDAEAHRNKWTPAFTPTHPLVHNDVYTTERIACHFCSPVDYLPLCSLVANGVER